MAWAFVQANGTGEAGSDTNVAHAYTTNNTAGNLLVLAVGWSPTATAISTVTDSAGNTWTQVSTNSPVDVSGGTFGFAVYYALNCAAGANTVTVTWGSAVTNKALACAEYSGIATASAFDVSVGQAQASVGTGTDAVTTGTSASATTQANDLIVAFQLHRTVGNGMNAGTNYTLRGGGALASDGSFYDVFLEDRNLATATTFAGTFTQNVDASGNGTIAAAFKEAAVGGSPTDARILIRPVGFV